MVLIVIQKKSFIKHVGQQQFFAHYKLVILTSNSYQKNQKKYLKEKL